MNASKTPVAIPYRRYSSKAQTSGSSELRQEAGFDTFLVSSGLPASAEAYWDRGHSGYHGKHLQNEFGRLLADCAAKKFPKGSVVWIEDMDRFGRMKQREVRNQWSTITEAGYGIHVASSGKTFWEHTDEMETLTIIIGSITAHAYSAKLAGRVKLARQRIRDTGFTKAGRKVVNCPTWMRISKEGTHYELNDKAELLRKACLLAIAGNGQTFISQTLKIKASGLTAFFRSRALIGEFQPCSRELDEQGERVKVGEPKENYYPPLLTVDEFRQLQSSLDSRKKQKGMRSVKVTNLFTDLMFNEIGEVMRVKTDSRGTHTIKRYVNQCWGSGMGMNYQLVEDAILDAFLALSKNDLYPADSSADQLQAMNLEATVADLTDKIDKWEEEAMNGGSAILAQWATKADAKREVLRKELEACRTRLTMGKAENLPQAKELITELLAEKTGKELIDLRSRLKAVINRVVRRIVITIHSPYSCSLEVNLVNGKAVSVGSVGKVKGLTVAVGIEGEDD